MSWLNSALKKGYTFYLLGENWNVNGVLPFKAELIIKVNEVLHTLEDLVEPEIFPTERQSIQLEWTIDNKYIEIEVFEDRIVLYTEEGGVTKLHSEISLQLLNPVLKILLT